MKAWLMVVLGLLWRSVRLVDILSRHSYGSSGVGAKSNNRLYLSVFFTRGVHKTY